MSKINQNRLGFFIAGTFLGGWVLNLLAGILRGKK